MDLGCVAEANATPPRYKLRAPGFGLVALIAVAGVPASAGSEPPPRVPPMADGTFEFTHPPYTQGTCDICHVRADLNDAGPARESISDICFSCHVELLNATSSAAYVHQPVRESCQRCHNPHNSIRPNLLVAEPRELCSSCHGAVAREVRRAKVSHGALTRGSSCTNCHDAHASNVEELLHELPHDLCVRCHSVDAFVDKRGKPMLNFEKHLAENPNRHGPVRSEECSTCHRPHGARHYRLLLESYPSETYTKDYRSERYALCYLCHSTEIIEEKVTRLTGFRKQQRNIHRVHVVEQRRGRSCRACHSVHASRQAFHIRESLPYGSSGWELKLNFTPSPDGGSCEKTCHETRVYLRGEPDQGEPSLLAGQLWRTIDGRELDLARAAEATVLVFFKPDQAFSVLALHQLKKCQTHFPREKARLVGVVREGYSKEAVRRAVASAELEIEVIVDETSRLENEYGIKAHPFFLVLDERGTPVERQAISKANVCVPLIERVLFARAEISRDELERATHPQSIAIDEERAKAMRYLGLATVLLKSRKYDDAGKMVRIAQEHDPASGAAHALVRAIRLAGGDRPQLEVPRASSRPTVDGDLTEFHAAPELRLRAGPAEASYRALWDDSALYLAVRVTDPDRFGRTGRAPRGADLRDGVGLWIDPDHDRLPAPDSCDWRYFVAATGELAVANGTGARPGRGKATATQAVRSRDVRGAPRSDGSYDVELAIPFTAPGIVPAPGKVLAVDFTLTNAGLGRVSRANWSGLSGFETPSEWNEIVLVEAPSTEVDGPERPAEVRNGQPVARDREEKGRRDAGGCGCSTIGAGSFTEVPLLLVLLLALVFGAVRLRYQSTFDQVGSPMKRRRDD